MGCPYCYWTARGYSRIANSQTRRFADWTSRRLVNSLTSHLADWTNQGLDTSRMPPAAAVFVVIMLIYEQQHSTGHSMRLEQ